MKAIADDLLDIAATNERFRREVERFDARFRCDDCAHVDPTTVTCSLGYPNAYLLGEVRCVQPDGNLAFCKYFELGEGR